MRQYYKLEYFFTTYNYKSSKSTVVLNCWDGNELMELYIKNHLGQFIKHDRKCFDVYGQLRSLLLTLNVYKSDYKKMSDEEVFLEML